MEIFVPYWGDPSCSTPRSTACARQTDGEWTLVVVDDCYPDPSVAEYFAAETDPRIRYVRNETNLGITENYRRCRDLATGELMMFLGCDDLLRPRLRRQRPGGPRGVPGCARSSRSASG